MSTGEGSGVGFATARGRDWPSVRQFNVFLENRVGGLLSVVRRFEATDIRIVSLIVNDLSDCAIIRLVLSDPERALEVFEQAKLPITESDLLVVQLPDGFRATVLDKQQVYRPARKGDLLPGRLEHLVRGHDNPAVGLDADLEIVAVVGLERGDAVRRGQRRHHQGCEH